MIGVVGPMARTTGDLKILFEVMQGSDIGDTSSAPVPVRWPAIHDLKTYASVISRTMAERQ